VKAQSNQAGAVSNRSMPPGTIIPEFLYEDLEAAVQWLCRTFGFKERLRIGNHRSQLVLGGASFIAVAKPTGPASFSSYIADQKPLQGEVTHSIMVRVEDVERHYEHVQRCGARIINPPTDFPYGERQYTAEDLAGHRWTFSQSIADVDPGEWGGVLLLGE
jgi:uncharacterized glyoxalase superfamily protein PhnB